MNEAHMNALIAVNDAQQLQTMHTRFVGELESAARQKCEFGSMSVNATTIECQYLNHNVTATHRPIAIEGKVRAIEYDFVVSWNDESLSVLRLYLQPNGSLTRDAVGSQRFQDFNNTYNKSHILAELSSALLSSEVFSPREA
jgi:hypothetical protein